MTFWARECLAKLRMGETATRTFDGRPILARAENHTWFGADPSKPETDHKGITLYELDEPSERVTVPDVELRGLDVSAFQPRIDWAKVAAAGFSFAFVKATEGLNGKGSLSEQFSAQWRGAREAGLERGAYHFFRSTSDPVAQMRRFVEVVHAEGLPDAPGYCIDVEWQNGERAPLGALDAPTFAQHVLDAKNELADLTGKPPVIYSAPGFWSLLPIGLRREIAKGARLWIAAYRSSPPDPLDGWDAWEFWQSSDHGEIPGIGKGDVNVWRRPGASSTEPAPPPTGDPATGDRLFKLAADVDAGAEGIPPTDRRPG